MSTPGAQRTRVAAACACLAAVVVNCSRQPDLDEVFEPPRPAQGARAMSTALADFELEPGGRTEFTLGSRLRRARGRVQLTQGRLQIDLDNLANTRGHLIFDLASVQVEADGERGAAPASVAASTPSLTEQSLRWLELNREEAVATQPQLRYARFVIRNIGSASATTAREGTSVEAEPGSAARRRVQMRVTGELELHGFRMPYTAAVAVTFRWAESTASSALPENVEVTLADGVAVDLVGHGVLPRDALGNVLAESLAELRAARAHEAKVTGHWVATRSGTVAAEALRPLPR